MKIHLIILWLIDFISLPKYFVQNRDGEYAEKYYLINTYVNVAVNPEKNDFELVHSEHKP